jgi:glycosyltransferase involved in cell wall biosynthesis
MNQTASSRIRVMRIIARMNVGGPAVQVSGLMRGFNTDEFEHRLYTGYCAVNEADYLETNATDVNALRISGFGRRISFIGDIRAFFTLVKEIHKFKPHIIHTHTAKAGFLGRFASILSCHRSIRVHTFHGHLLNGYFGSFKRSLIIFAERILSGFTHQLLAVGHQVREDLLHAGIGTREKFAIMPPGLSLNHLPKKDEALEILGLEKKYLQCALIGRVTQIKRPDRFLDVVSELQKRGVKLNFLIAGDGELLESCRQRISQEKLPVKVLGWCNDIEIVLSAADIVALTSDNEGTPLSLIQAGMAGLPVVATNVGSVTDVVLSENTGIITSLDVTEFADALERLVTTKSLRMRLGDTAKEFTLTHFGVERLVRDHEALYMNLLSNQANS